MSLCDVHALDTDAPVLTSTEALRHLQDVVDFGTGRAVLQRSEPTKYVNLEQAQTGHLFVDLSSNCMPNAKPLSSTSILS